MAKKPNNEDVSLDMTPMIDVVFQLIIFFVVTLKMTDNRQAEIKLEDGVHGIVLTHEELPPSQLTRVKEPALMASAVSSSGAVTRICLRSSPSAKVMGKR